jgi:hypothetical protein
MENSASGKGAYCVITVAKFMRFISRSNCDNDLFSGRLLHSEQCDSGDELQNGYGSVLRRRKNV